MMFGEPADKLAKRVRCGECKGCTGNDCGECANCRDKPRFGGAGVKKQACFSRRCIYVKQREEAAGVVPRPLKRQKSLPLEQSVGSVDLGIYQPAVELNELDEVDLDPDIQRALLEGTAELSGIITERPPSAPSVGRPRQNSMGGKTGKAEGGKKRGTLQRCGQCGPCTRADCGSCQNCLDKPKFGGPGLRKQACEKKRCLTMTPRYATPSPPLGFVSNATKSDSPTGAEKLVPCSVPSAPPMLPSPHGMTSAWSPQTGDSLRADALFDGLSIFSRNPNAVRSQPGRAAISNSAAIASRLNGGGGLDGSFFGTSAISSGALATSAGLAGLGGGLGYLGLGSISNSALDNALNGGGGLGGLGGGLSGGLGGYDRIAPFARTGYGMPYSQQLQTDERASEGVHEAALKGRADGHQYTSPELDVMDGGASDAGLLGQGEMLGLTGGDELIPLKSEGAPMLESRCGFDMGGHEAEGEVTVEDDYHSWLCDDY